MRERFREIFCALECKFICIFFAESKLYTIFAPMSIDSFLVNLSN